MNIVPIKDLKNTVKIEQLCRESNAPVFVTKNGYGSLVVMNIDYYTETMKAVEEAKLIFEGLDDIKKNNLYDGKKVMEGLKDKYGL